jgi:uncharacterized damage-inducible protein DinB
MSSLLADASFISPAALLDHWQGHRRLTRHVIEAFPEDRLFEFSIGGMRTFGELTMEMLGMAEPMVRGISTGEWETFTPSEVRTRDEVLRLWDEATEGIGTLWSRIPASRFHERTTAFGMYEGVIHNLLLYAIDNEIHHRGQGYVYLRAQGIEPPPFYIRD